MKFLKNILIIIIALGLLTPYVPAQAVSPRGLIGGFITEPIQAKKDAAHLASLSKHVGVVFELTNLCLKGLATNVYGSCSIELEKANQKFIDESARIAEKKVGWLQKALDFVDEMAYILFKKVILDRLVDAFVQWIQRGGQGSIIGDWGQFFDDAGNIAAGEFVQGLGAGFLCSPFSLNLRLALLPVPTFSKVTCTLDQIIGNINNFFEDFRNGNWLAYQETWYPRNNFYGGTIIAIDESAKAEALGRDAAEKEALAGRGFLSWTKEIYIEDPTGPYKNQNGDFADAGYEGIRYKKIKRTMTPGTIAADTVTEVAIKTQFTRLIHAEDLSAYLTAIVDASINVLTKEGIKWLANAASRNAPPRINAQFPCAGLTGDAFKSCQYSVNSERKDFENSRSAIQSATTGSLSVRIELSNVLNQSIALQESYVEALSKLVSAGRTERTQELADEQAILDGLKDKLESNQSITNAIQAQDDKINDITPAAGITVDDYVALGNVNTQFVGDEFDAQEALLDAEKELEKIKEKVNSKLPEILSQLPAAPSGGQ